MGPILVLPSVPLTSITFNASIEARNRELDLELDRETSH